MTSRAPANQAPDSVGANRIASAIPAERLLGTARALLDEGLRLALVCAHDDGDSLRVVYLFLAGPPDRRVELHVRLHPTRPEVPSLAGLSFPAGRFEREMHDLFGIEPVGHPQPRRLVLHQHWPPDWLPMRIGSGQPPAMVDDAGSFPFVPVEGAGVYEIPVGPVHAGLIEPGHFRFWVVGETILRMKARLWFVHKGIERLLQGKDVSAGLQIAERISGDSAVGHGLAFCLAVEDALQYSVPPNAQLIRAVLLELERIYNHATDIGALCNDAGFALPQARALELREHLLRLNAEVTGHRLLRGGVLPGGARLLRLPTAAELAWIAERCSALVSLATSNSMVMERFAGTATLDRSHATELGVVGVTARASGLWVDARLAHPAVDPCDDFSVAVQDRGDVHARFAIRTEEIASSLALIGDYATKITRLSETAAWPPSPRNKDGVGIVEGWRGTIVQRVELDASDRLTRVKIVDPSFLNWPALAIALSDTIVPDFPLANKSFNLSYAGNDL